MALLVLLSFLGGCSAKHIDWSNQGAPAGTGFLRKELSFEGQSCKYTVFIPHGYNGQARYPVIMFLHGVLESGSDGQKCVTVGLGPTVSQQAGTFNFIVVFPQSPSDWQSDLHQRLAMATLDQVLKDYPAADRDRVYLTGLSNGGDGTWIVGAAYRDRFAALAPMCSAVDYDDAPRLTGIPIWCVHNRVDPFRSSGRAKEMCRRISQAGGNAKYTEYGGFGHDCWSRAFGEGEVFQWMLSQRRAAGK